MNTIGITEMEQFFKAHCGTNGIPSCNQCEHFKDVCTHPEHPLNRQFADAVAGGAA